MKVEDVVVAALKNTVDLVVEGKIMSATWDIGNQLKAKVSMTSKGFAKIERTKTEKATSES